MPSASLIDSHCHLDFNHFKNDFNAVLDRASQFGIKRIIVPGVDIKSSSAALELSEIHKNIYATVGVHPNSAKTWNKHTQRQLEQLLKHPKVVAVGEIGLDFYRHHSPREIQQVVFKSQLKIAAQAGLPIVIHTRNESVEDRACFIKTLEILTDWRREVKIKPHSKHLRNRSGVFHAFSGNEENVRSVLELGFYVGVAGPLTFKNARGLRRVISSVPLRRILIETDAPFLTPHPYRGKRNEPAYVRFIAEGLASLLRRSMKAVSAITTHNAEVLFDLSD